MKYAINEQIKFEMNLEAAKIDYQHQRKVEARKFRKAMRKAAMFGKPHDKRKTKRCGRARP